ncbi:hypothetical protein [Anabaena azotica]|uniref:Uncharacterized protein n=1 Tax=Anabaena azotica FACHB-119 TaxID=947527 RepID=A0ABR8D5C4_9NOST|nr:hypothetical protein [Anabaena azotica]MBD2501904.1 hypothetical protein [Anabaena azotica FACHB-119]
MVTPNKEKALLLLRQTLDNTTSNFRPGQWEAIEELIERRSRLLVLLNNQIKALVATTAERQVFSSCLVTALISRYPKKENPPQLPFKTLRLCL